MHVKSEPGILYFGTPVVLISTVNEDGSYNLAPMSSAFWLGWRCIIGLAAASKTPQNIIRTGECVLNVPSADMVDAVNSLALTTGSDPVPEYKVHRGYRFEREKFQRSGLTPVRSETVAPPRVLECPVQLEARLEATHGVAEEDAALRGRILTFELRVQRVYLDESILADGDRDRVDPDRWRPLIMSFQRFYGLGAELRDSTLATIPESVYRGSDVARARRELLVESGSNAPGLSETPTLAPLDHGKRNHVCSGGQGAGSPAREGARGRVSLTLGCHRLQRGTDRRLG